MKTEYSSKTYPLYNYRIEKVKRYKNIPTTIIGSIETYVRKKYEGRYYLTLVRIQHESRLVKGLPQKVQTCLVFNMLLQRLMVDAYRFITLGIVIPEETSKMRDTFNRPIGAILDPDQSSEMERYHENSILEKL